MIGIKEESRKDKNIKEDVSVGKLLSSPAYTYPVLSVRCFPFGYIEQRTRREEPQTRPLRSSCSCAFLGEAAASDHEGEGRCNGIVENPKILI